MATRKDENAIFRIPPYYYIHVLDQNTNVTRIEIGPQTYIRQDNQRVTLGPEKMVVVPPRHYCVIENPVCRDKDGRPVIDNLGQIKLQHADQDIRLTQDPFPLYPGEVLKQPVTALKVVPANAALRIRAILDFDDDDGEKRTAGDEWLFEGPGNKGRRAYVVACEFNGILEKVFDCLGGVAPTRTMRRKSKKHLKKMRRKLMCLNKQGQLFPLIVLIFSSALLGICTMVFRLDEKHFVIFVFFAVFIGLAVDFFVKQLQNYLVKRFHLRRKKMQLYPGVS